MARTAPRQRPLAVTVLNTANMKNWILITFLLLIITNANGQGFAIEVAYNNYFYAGLNNWLLIAAERTSNNDLVFETTHGKILQENGDYYFYSDSIGQCKITVFKREKNKLTKIGAHTYYVREIPKPELIIGNTRNRDSIFLNELNIHDYVYAKLYNFAPTDPHYLIDSFRINIYCKELSSPKKILNTSNMLSKEIMDEFKELNSGCKIEFSDIHVRISSDGRNIIKDKKRVYKLDPMTIFIR